MREVTFSLFCLFGCDQGFSLPCQLRSHHISRKRKFRPWILVCCQYIVGIEKHSLASSQIWQSPLVDCCLSSWLAKLLKKNHGCETLNPKPPQTTRPFALLLSSPKGPFWGGPLVHIFYFAILKPMKQKVTEFIIWSGFHFWKLVLKLKN
jgi:hypothetical protein